MRNKSYILGFDIGGTKTSLIIGDFNGTVYQKISFPTETETGFENSFDKICSEAETLLKNSFAKADYISVSIGGPLDSEKGIIYSPPHLPGWDAVPLKDKLGEYFQLPTFVEHDGNCGALAEYFFGAGKGYKNVIFITMGTGFGAGFIFDGRLYRGTTNMAGEIGHIRIAEHGPEEFGKPGSLEGYCSGSGIAKLAGILYPKRWGRAKTTARDISYAAKRGDNDAIRVIRTTAHYLGRGLALLIDCLNPEIIIIGSIALHLGDIVLKPALEEMRREALARTAEACRVTIPVLGEKLGDVASLCAAIYNVENKNASGN